MIRIRTLSVLVLAFAPAAIASDGVLEINQTCAVQTGCFTGDPAGFPVTITQPATSYRLTGALSVPNEFTTGVVVSASASDVRIDLGGFAIRGDNQCSLPPVVCTRRGTGFGIEIQSERVSVEHGRVVGLGSVGIYAPSGSGHSFRDVTVAHNTFQGIRVDSRAATVEGVTALQNGTEGILLDVLSVVSHCVAYLNGSDGISGSLGSAISESRAHSNGSVGIRVSGSSTVSGNTAYANGSDGIRAGFDSIIEENHSSANQGFGLRIDPASPYRGNTVGASNVAGTVTGGLNMGGNSCNGTTTCP